MPLTTAAKEVTPITSFLGQHIFERSVSCEKNCNSANANFCRKTTIRP